MEAEVCNHLHFEFEFDMSLYKFTWYFARRYLPRVAAPTMHHVKSSCILGKVICMLRLHCIFVRYLRFFLVDSVNNASENSLANALIEIDPHSHKVFDNGAPPRKNLFALACMFCRYMSLSAAICRYLIAEP